jgi:hypothetical protein
MKYWAGGRSDRNYDSRAELLSLWSYLLKKYGKYEKIKQLLIEYFKNGKLVLRETTLQFLYFVTGVITLKNV